MARKPGREQALWYLAGLWDGEGCIWLEYRQGKSYSRRMDVVNTDSSIIDMACYCLDLLEIPYHLSVKKRPPHKTLEVVTLRGGRSTFEFMRDNLPLGSIAKAKKLDELVESYLDPVDRPSIAELERLYCIDDLNTAQIGEIFSVSGRTICNWLEDAGIERRAAHKRKVKDGQA